MKYIFSIVVLFFISCSEETETTNTEAQITGYKVTRNSQSTDPNFPSVWQSITNGIVQNGKLQEINKTVVDNGVNQPVELLQSFTYQNDLLTSHTSHPATGMPRILNFFYDSNFKLIGCTRVIDNMDTYYRFVHVTDDLIYFEKISLPYNDPATQIQSRCIAVFEGDNIVQAGRDSNLDGVMENVNYFQYNNGNLISASNSTESLSLNYSSVINNMNTLYDNSYGKKNRRIVCMECFSFAGFQSVLDYSKNLTNDELSGAAYEIHPSNYYHLKTNSEAVGPPLVAYTATITTTTEFFFN